MTKQMLISLTSLVFFCSLTNKSIGQEESKRLRLGLTMGAFLPSKAYARFLDGSHPNGVNRVLTDPNIRPQLEELFGYEIINWTYPGNMRYDINLYLGGHFSLRMDEDFSFIMNVNLMKTSVNQVLLISLNNPQNIGGTFEQAMINAVEQRFDLMLGLENEFGDYQGIEFYAAGGGLFNYNQLERHQLVIRNSLRYDIMRPQFIGGQGQRQRYNGYGYGFFANLGLRYPVSQKFTLDLGVEVNLTQNKQYVSDLVENTGYPTAWAEEAGGFKLNGGAYLRMIWN